MDGNPYQAPQNTELLPVASLRAASRVWPIVGRIGAWTALAGLVGFASFMSLVLANGLRPVLVARLLLLASVALTIMGILVVVFAAVGGLVSRLMR